MKFIFSVLISSILAGCCTSDDAPPEIANIQIHMDSTIKIDGCKKLGPVMARLNGIPWSETNGNDKIFHLLRYNAYEKYKADTVVLLNRNTAWYWDAQGIAYNCYSKQS